MKLCRFSPIKNQTKLLAAIKHTHFFCHKLCLQSFGRILPNAGNVGIFCHYIDEYKLLLKMREKLTDISDNIDQKYFRLRKPIIIPAKGIIPKTVYTYLYIRKPDPYRHHVGDVDFFLPPVKYSELKNSILHGTKIKGARMFERGISDMIELYDPDIDALGYVRANKMPE
jgi:hypothetical protein